MQFYAVQVGSREMLLREPSIERVRHVVERWIRLFWRRWVERVAESGLGKGSLAYAICSDPDVLAVIIACSGGSSPSVIGIEREVVASFRVADVLVRGEGAESTVRVA